MGIISAITHHTERIGEEGVDLGNQVEQGRVRGGGRHEVVLGESSFSRFQKILEPSRLARVWGIGGRRRIGELGNWRESLGGIMTKRRFSRLPPFSSRRQPERPGRRGRPHLL